MNRHKNYLREIAKFASGLMFGDFLMGIWLMTSGMAQTKIGKGARYLFLMWKTLCNRKSVGMIPG